MNTNSPSEGRFTRSCQKALAQIAKARQTIFNRFRWLIADHEQALRLALNEAEALAWETPFPHLVFTDLAEEKALAVAAWSKRQRRIQRQTAPAIA